MIHARAAAAKNIKNAVENKRTQKTDNRKSTNPEFPFFSF